MCNKCPPLGLMPKWLWMDYRRIDVQQAIIRRILADYPIPPEWVAEYNECIQFEKNRREKQS